MAVLFLDYDGVLHPNEVYLQTGRSIELRADGHALFEHGELLSTLLAPHLHIRIVLSTSWVAALRSFNEAKGYLPKVLQERVIGSTWHSGEDRYRWDAMTRYEQVMSYVLRHRLPNWIAIDDDAAGWPEDKRHHLVHTDAWGGLGDAPAQADLIAKLNGLKGTQDGVSGDNRGKFGIIKGHLF
jgi:hypothetical protein